MSWYDRRWKPYVPVARRRAQAAQYATRLAKKQKRALSPIAISGRKIAQSFWGAAWCDNLERYSDFENRLPRGRTYVRNGSVIDLVIEPGVVKALVSGSSVYTVKVTIDKLAWPAWKKIRQDCSRSIDSLIDLLQGKFDQGIMRRLTERDGGLFPKPREIKMSCSCPDWATLCKHVAATLYGVGARLDASPELLFLLRDVDHLELISQAVSAENLDRTMAAGSAGALAGSDLGELFGIELDGAPQTAAAEKPVAKPGRRGRKKAVRPEVVHLPPPEPVVEPIIEPSSAAKPRRRAAAKSPRQAKPAARKRGRPRTRTVAGAARRS